MASTSCAKQSLVPVKEPASNCNPYPQPIARYEDVIENSKLFMASLEKFHTNMGTKFMIPIIGGKELDLHRLFMEVTSRGGIDKVIKERRWKEVTAIFNFPSTATNASFVLRKYYGSLLQHYEQVYYFKAQGWTPAPTGSLQNSSVAANSVHRAVWRSPEIQATATPQAKINATESPGVPAGPVPSFSGSPVIGVIDGKFESGYLVTVTIGSKKLKGVLYQAPQNEVPPVPQQYNVTGRSNENAVPGMQRRRRRKKSEIKKRDPAHPKPNRSGYNFFFAEQHARLKPLHPGKDREISRMIGELWNKLKDSERAVYQEMALKDKERYRVEMEDYRERLRTGQVISDAVPLQQRLPDPGDIVEVNVRSEETEGCESPKTYYECSCGDSDSEEDKTEENGMDLDLDASATVGVTAEPCNVPMETDAKDAEMDLPGREANAENDMVEKVGDERDEKLGDKE